MLVQGSSYIELFGNARVDIDLALVQEIRGGRRSSGSRPGLSRRRSCRRGFYGRSAFAAASGAGARSRGRYRRHQKLPWAAASSGGCRSGLTSGTRRG
jgi:hypothetical protein